MAGLARQYRTAATRSAESPRPVRQTRQALRARRAAEAAEAANVAADETADEAGSEPAATPQSTHDVVEVAAQDPAADDRFPPAARRYMPQPDPDTAFTSPASNDFYPETQTLDFNMQSPARVSYLFPPNRLPRESVGGLESANDASRFEAPRTRNLNLSPSAAAQQDNTNQADEDEYESSSSEPEKLIQRRPTGPRRTHFDDAHASDETAFGVVTALQRNPRAKERQSWAGFGTVQSHYQRGNQNPSQYLSEARANLPMPNTPKRPNQSPSRDPLRGLGQANMLKRQRTIDEKEEEENEEEEGAFETNTRPAKQRVTVRENGEKFDGSHAVVPPLPQPVVNRHQSSLSLAKFGDRAGDNAPEHKDAASVAAHSRDVVPPRPEPVLNDRQGSASRANSMDGAEDNHSEHNEAAGARVNNGDLGALDIIEVSVKARETTLKYRSGTKKPQYRSPWPAEDTAKLIAAISKHGCSWSVLEAVLNTLSTPRSQQQIRDKARNMKVDFLLGDLPLPHGFDGIALGKKEREKVISYERNPDREEADIDDHGKPKKCRYAGE